VVGDEKMKKVFIVKGKRTPFGRYCGALKNYDYYDLGAIPVREIIKDIPKRQVGEMALGLGDTSPTKDVFTPLASRQIAIKAGLPLNLVTTCIEKACVSSTSAARYIFNMIRFGEIDCGIAAGCTSFSQTPYVIQNARIGKKPVFYDPVETMGIIGYPTMMQEVNDVATEYGVTRDDVDNWAYGSHRKYQVAFDRGKFDVEIISLPELSIDEQFRRDVNWDKLHSLKSIEGNITAGNCPGKNDGAAAILLMSEDKMIELGLEPMAELVDIISTAGNPTRTAEGPGWGVRKILEKHNLSLSDIDLFEVNEAFASLIIVFLKMLGNTIGNRTNVHGGAIAIGHANAASGVRIMLTLTNALKDKGGIGVGSIGGALGLADTFILRRE
jgi:acetyl-CoA C-acetyltransferase